MRSALSLIPVFLVSLMACSKGAEMSAPAVEALAPVNAQLEAPSRSTEARPVVPRKLIKTVDLALEVPNTQEAADAIQQIASSEGGYVSKLSASERGQLLYYDLTIRVPVDQLDGTVAKLKGLSVDVRRESIRAEDVTASFVDLEARLRTLRATEDELLSLLGESRKRNQDAKDIMAIYEQLTDIRTKIEQIQGQLRLLENQTSLSTVNVELIPTEASKPLVGERWRPSETVRAKTRVLVEALQVLADLAIGLVIVVIPVALLVGLPVFGVALLVRRYRARRTPSDADHSEEIS